jgi:beta-lactamase regulating signal transducer with metallopeptidase domain
MLPLIEISSPPQQPEISENLMLMLQSAIIASNTSNIELMQQPETATVTWLHVLLLIYIAGIIFLSIRNIYSSYGLYKLIKSGKRQTLENDITLIVHNNNIAPFSWFGYIVISKKDFEENGKEIIIHEKAHIKKLHSIDLLICHVFNIMQWINPVVWLFKRELQNIHEYEADEAVLKKGINTKQYQLLLIQKAVGAKLFALANNFNKSKLQKRITMMSKNKSNPYSRLKYLYVLPMFAIVVTAFASPQVKNEMEKISSVSIGDFIRQNEDEQKANTNANASDSTMLAVFNQMQINDSTDNSQISVTLNSQGNLQDTITVFTDSENGKISNSDVLIIVDDKIVNSMDDIDKTQIESISVIKNDTKAKKDDAEKNNIILVKTKKGNEENKKTKIQAYTSTMSINNGNAVMYVTCDTLPDSLKNYAYSFYFNNNDIKKFNIDSLYKPHFYFSKSQNDSLKKKLSYYSTIHSDSLKNWNIKIEAWNDSLKNILSYHSKIHSDSLKNWNFKIKSWDDSIKNVNLNYYFNWDSDKSADIFDPNILVIVDGKEMKFDEFAKMGRQIGTISVLKDKDAIKKYGIKARKGVIIVETKDK